MSVISLNGREGRALVPSRPRLTASEDRVMQPRPLKHVVILGMGASASAWINHQVHFPKYHDEEGFEVWAINEASFAFRHDMVLSAHDMVPYSESGYLKPSLVEGFKRATRPILCTGIHPEMPTSMEFPLSEAVELFNETYFANTLSYGIAFALMCGARKIDLYGCDYNYQTRQGLKSPYEIGRCNVEYWLGIAKMWDPDNPRGPSGAMLSVPGSTMLLDAASRGSEGIYGYGKRQPIFDVSDPMGPRVLKFKEPNERVPLWVTKAEQ